MSEGKRPCGHSTYWATVYDNCMACRAEQAEAKLAALQATLAEREARIAELEKMNGNLGNDRVQFLLKSVGLEADLDTARQDAARLREAAQNLT